MNSIHFSFDIWNTLLTSSPKFSEARNRIILEVVRDFKLADPTMEQITTSVNHVKRVINGLHATGTPEIFSPSDAYEMVLDHLILRCPPPHCTIGTIAAPIVTTEDVQVAAVQITALVTTAFIQNPPILNPEVAEAFSQLATTHWPDHGIHHVSFGTYSNTCYVGGEVTRRMIHQLYPTSFKALQTALHSDAHPAKPSIEGTHMLLEQALNTIPSSIWVDKLLIIHVGDDSWMDSLGANLTTPVVIDRDGSPVHIKLGIESVIIDNETACKSLVSRIHSVIDCYTW